MKTETLSYRGLSFVIPTLGKEGMSLSPRASRSRVPADSPLCRAAETVWDLRRFEEPGRFPCPIDLVSNRAEFSRRNDLRVLDLPIKFPGSCEYRVPSELGQFCEALQTCIDHHHAFNASAIDYYAYVTIDQGVVKKGTLQRNAGCHVDGFQGARIDPKVRINQSYVCSNAMPTVFYPHPFHVAHLDPAKDNFFLEFDRQADEALEWHAEPFVPTLMDAYSVHRSAVAQEDTYRTFMRLTYEVRIFDRLGNAHNPMFDYEWDMVPRDVHRTLVDSKPCRSAV